MAKLPQQIDALVLGDHPCAYLAAILLQRGGVSVLHAKVPNEHHPDRSVVINPQMFELDDALRSLRRRLDLVPTYGLKFLADEPSVMNESVRKTIGAYVGSFWQVQSEISKLAKTAGVGVISPNNLEFNVLDEQGVEAMLGGSRIRAKLLILAGELPIEQQKQLGLPIWAPDALSRYTFVKVKALNFDDQGKRPLILMSLNLKGTHHWAWLLPGKNQLQLAIEQPYEPSNSTNSAELLRHWAQVLATNGILKVPIDRIGLDRATNLVLPLAGALTGEGVANRTLCIGPAGGFFTACAEELYPCFWSSVCAADVARVALKERHLQDAIQSYRQRWGATLGDYLRGPQQNLRFLLPLVYRNNAMASRLTDAILFGKSVVR